MAKLSLNCLGCLNLNSFCIVQVSSNAIWDKKKPYAIVNTLIRCYRFSCEEGVYSKSQEVERMLGVDTTVKLRKQRENILRTQWLSSKKSQRSRVEVNLQSHTRFESQNQLAPPWKIVDIMKTLLPSWIKAGGATDLRFECRCWCHSHSHNHTVDNWNL